jgi:ABC-type sugar transport system substrate-binding protein
MRHRYKLTAVALGVVALLVVGCGSSSSSNSSSSASTAAATSSEATSTSAPAGSGGVSGKTIGFVNIVANEASQRAESAFREAAGVFGWKVVSGSRAKEVVTAQQSVQTLLNENVDGIVLQSVDPGSIGPQLQEAKAKGVPIITQEVGAGYSYLYSGQVLAIPDWNFGAQGEDIANLFIQSILQETKGKGGEVIVFTGEPSLPSQQLWTGALHNQLKDNPQIKIIAEHTVDYTKAGEDISNYLGQQLKAHPNLKGVWTDANLEAPATVSAVEAAGLKGKVVITTFFGDQDLLKLIREGGLTGTVDVPVNKGSWLSVDALADYFSGKPVNKKEPLENPLTPLVITKQNVPAEGQQIPYPEFKPEFKSKWCKEYKVGC